MAKPKTTAVPASHAANVGNSAHAGMRHLAVTGRQSVQVDPNVSFAELQDEGPTARAPRSYKGK